MSAPVTWHAFDPDTFEVGRTLLPLTDDTVIGLYDAQRSIIDAIRLRHREGSSLAYDALRRWLRRRGSSPSRLLATGRQFRGAEQSLRQALPGRGRGRRPGADQRQSCTPVG